MAHDETLNQQLQRTLLEPIRSISLETERLLIDSIACSLHNNGYSIEGNTAESDENWLAVSLWMRFNQEVPGRWEGLPSETKEFWRKIAEASIVSLPGLMARIAHRCVLHSQALRTIEKGMRSEGNAREKVTR